jgi:hypothetical protein
MYGTFHEIFLQESYDELLEMRSKLGHIPEWIPEMENNPQLVIDMYKASVPI